MPTRAAPFLFHNLNWCLCRPLEEGDIVNVDITVYYKGMHGDLNETYACGSVTPDKQRLLQGAYLCLMEAVKSVRQLETAQPDERYGSATACLLQE